jgi:hypothetical protein
VEVEEDSEGDRLDEEPANGEYTLPLSVNVLVALRVLSLVPGRIFDARKSEPPNVFAVPGLNTTEGVAVREDLVKVK